MTDRPGPGQEAGTGQLTSIDVERCWQLLAGAGVGRLAVCLDGDAPIVVPVNYRVEDRTILFRTGPGTKLDLLHDRPVSFQVDSIDPAHRSGWSVLVRGVASIDDARTEADEAPVPWAGAERRTMVRIWPASVTGREVVAGDHDFDPRGYL
ncbi:MAG TPA: pyridoxamine 5'-phosphate oxidase family protein [Acidimicrobiales bacterium]|nr:pyridoxamine 5'-phosphate oxidase family protein [Acidimicrobiales bacterium]